MPEVDLETLQRRLKGLFPEVLGVRIQEATADLVRGELTVRADLCTVPGVMHGGALATLIDTVVVPAIGAAYEDPRMLFTIDMHVSYLDTVAGEDAIAEGWVEKRGRSTVFCRVEVRSASGVLATTASLVYKVSSRPAARA